MPRQGEIDPLLSDPELVAPTGIAGLDDVLNGGLARGRLYLVEGDPRLRKDDAGDAVPDRRRAAAVSRSSTSRCRRRQKSWRRSPTRTAGTSAACTIRELLPDQEARSKSDEQYTMFHPSEVELAATTKVILEDVRAARSRRGWCSTRCRSCAWWPATRCATGARSSRSSNISRAASCTVILLDDMTATRPRPACAEHRARRDPAAAHQPRVRRRAPAHARHQVSRHRSSAAATTTT